MQRQSLLATALALGLAAAMPFAMAQDAPAAPATASVSHPLPPGHAMMRMHRAEREHGRRDHREARMHGHGPHAGAFADVRALEHLYRQAGRTRDLTALYNEVLAKSQDPMLRSYAYHHLARLQAQPTNIEQAAATLHKSLDENLANEAKQRAAREQMRSQWQQRHTAATPAATR